MTRASYSAEFKANAVRRLSTPGQDALALASELGVHESLLYRWRRKAGTPSPMPKRPPPRRSAISTPSAITSPSAASTPQTASSTTPASEPRPKRRPQDWTQDEKIAAVIESMSLTEEQLGGFLRQRGLYRATLDEWRESVLRGARAELGGHAAKKAEAAEAKRVRELERDLSRKEKALAEMGALLVLQKNERCKSSEETIQAALTGNYRPEHVQGRRVGRGARRRPFGSNEPGRGGGAGCGWRPR